MLRIVALPASALRRFARNEDGAVTVDWVVLTAGIVGIVLVLFTSLTEALYEGAGQSIASDIENSTR